MDLVRVPVASTIAQLITSADLLGHIAADLGVVETLDPRNW
ncbi:MAG: hypothetical protein ABIV94_08840 [Acidimicrobiales bacterium]